MSATKAQWFQWGVTLAISLVAAWLSMVVSVERIGGKVDALRQVIEAKQEAMAQRITRVEDDVRSLR